MTQVLSLLEAKGNITITDIITVVSIFILSLVFDVRQKRGSSGVLRGNTEDTNAALGHRDTRASLGHRHEEKAKGNIKKTHTYH